MDTIGRINLKLSELGKTGAEMSRDLGLSNGTYSQWNTRKSKPSNKTLAAVASYLGTTVEYLLTGEEQQKKPAPEVGDELNSGYYDLTPDNRALIDAMIEKLLKSQSDD